MPLDLRSLPTPQLLAEPDPQVLFEALLTLFQTFDPTYAYFLASDPVVKELQSIAYAEWGWRQHMNDLSRMTLIALARAEFLDHIAAREDVTRLVIRAASGSEVEVLEADEAFRERIMTKIRGRSSAGPADHYRYYALSSDTRVKDAKAYSPDFSSGFNMGGRVNVAILSNEAGNVCSLDLIDAVKAVVLAPDVRVVTDLVTVEPAIAKTFNLVATIILDDKSPIEVFTGLNASFQAAFYAMQTLGRDVTPSWIMRTLMVDGVYNVTIQNPTSALVVAPNEFPQFLTVDIIFGGYATSDDFDASALQRRDVYDRVYRYYIDFCIRHKRTYQLIASDLTKEEREGIIQPTTEGVANFLGIRNIRSAAGVLIPEYEIAFLSTEALQPYYDAAV